MTSYNNAFSYNNIVFIFLSSYVCNIIMTLYPIPERESKNSASMCYDMYVTHKVGGKVGVGGGFVNEALSQRRGVGSLHLKCVKSPPLPQGGGGGAKN